MGESTRFGGDLERLGFEGVVGVEGGLEGVEEGLEKEDLVGVAGFGDEGTLLVDVDFDELGLGDDGFGEGSLVSRGLEDDFFGVDGSGAGVGLVGAVCGNAPIGVAFGGAAFGGAAGVDATGVAVRGSVLDTFVFEDVEAFAAVSFAPAFFGVAVVVVGLDSGLWSIKDATGAFVGGAVNCPLAIWRARSLTLTNMLTRRRVHVQQNDPGGAHAFYDEHDSFREL